MKKSLSLIALIAIIAMLFTACSPEPASAEDIAAAQELMNLVEEAGRNHYIDSSEAETTPDNYTVSLIEVYKSPSTGNTLTEFTYTQKISETSRSLNVNIVGIIEGEPYTMKMSASMNNGDQEPAYSVTINGKTIDPNSFEAPF